MDPLSVAASVLAVLTAAGKTAQGLEQIWALRDASKDLLCVMSEVSHPCKARTGSDLDRAVQLKDDTSGG
jgi:hypothetical protein